MSVWERVSASMFHIYAGGLVALAMYARLRWPIMLVIAIHAWMDFFTGGVAQVLGLSLYGLETMFSACAVATWLVFLLAARGLESGALSATECPHPTTAPPRTSSYCLRNHLRACP